MSNTQKCVISGPSLGFCGLLTILFIGLKLGHVIDWSWWLVLLPLYGPWTLFFLVFIVLGVILTICARK